MSEEQKPTNVVDVEQPSANMYGCLPCPRCQSVYRVPYVSGWIHCDDCGFRERAGGEPATGRPER